MLKKWLSSSLLAAMVIVLLVGCSSNTGSNAGGNTSKTNTESGQTTLKVYTWYNLENEKFDVIKSEFEKAYPNIKIEYVSAGDNNANEHVKKVDLAAASNEDMDVIMFSSPAHYAQRLALGMLEPLDDYLAKDGLNFDEEYSVDTKVDGKYYGLPGKSVNFFVAINENHLKEANLPLPTDWTWDEFLDYAAKMTKLDGEKKRYGTYFHTWVNPYVMLANANVADNSYLVTDDFKSANIDTASMRKSLEIRLQADQDKIATPYAEVISQKLNYRPQYFNEEASMILTGTFMIPEVGGTDKVPATFKTVFAPMPKMNKEDPTTSDITSDLVTVYSKSKNKQAAYTFARWFTTEGLVVQGRNIPSWKKANLENVLDVIIDATNNPEMVDKASALRFFNESQMIVRPNP
ncbi:MAG TPA: extracellular solute-binding protein, partial [Candidatus Paenibacillus intestinavium]|nr:extracellular solute-binding protein [Candidatus Paenibacillus intestinavium]